MRNYKTANRTLEVKSVDDAGHFKAYGSVFNNVDLHGDVILPGAFRDTLKKHKDEGKLPLMLWQHNIHEPIGVYSDMVEDDYGLVMEGNLLINENVPEADKAHTLMKHKAVRGTSIGFNVPPGGEKFNGDKGVWEINTIDLVEVSIVTLPANPLAEIVDVKGFEDPREFEGLLRDVLGLSQSQAKALMSEGYKAMQRKRDVDGASVLGAIEQLHATVTRG